MGAESRESGDPAERGGRALWLGTTALVAAGFAAQDARAADPISLSVGGFQNWGTYFSSTDDASYKKTADVDSFGIRYEGEVHFKGKTVLDNGLEVGVRFELEGEEQDGDQLDETYAYVEGSFGTLRIGNDDAVSYSMATTAPYATFIWGLNTPSFSLGAEGNTLSTLAGVGIGDSASVMYFTPVLNGIQLGVSFAPEAGQERSSSSSYEADPEGGQAWSVAARYDGTIGGMGVTLAAGYASWDVEPVDAVSEVTGRYLRHLTDRNGNRFDSDHTTLRHPLAGLPENATAAQKKAAETARKELLEGSTNMATGVATTYEEIQAPALAAAAKPARSPSEWDVGLVLSMDNISVGGSYREMDKDDGSDETTAYDLGVSYGEGPWGLSLNWGRSTSDDKDNDMYRLLTTYSLGAGVSLTGAVGMNRPEKENADSEFVGMAIATSF